MDSGERSRRRGDAEKQRSIQSTPALERQVNSTYLASSPYNAVFTNALVLILLAIAWASLYVGAPFTVTVTNLVAPSPSRTTSCARSAAKAVSSVLKVSNASGVFSSQMTAEASFWGAAAPGGGGAVSVEHGKRMAEGRGGRGGGQIVKSAEGHTVSQEVDRIVGRHIAVDGDRVEGAVDGVGESRLERARGDGGIGEDEPEKRCV